MAKVRIYELAKSRGVSANYLVDALREQGVKVKSTLSTVDEDVLKVLDKAAEKEAQEEVQKKDGSGEDRFVTVLSAQEAPRQTEGHVVYRVAKPLTQLQEEAAAHKIQPAKAPAPPPKVEPAQADESAEQAAAAEAEETGKRSAAARELPSRLPEPIAAEGPVPRVVKPPARRRKADAKAEEPAKPEAPAKETPAKAAAPPASGAPAGDAGKAASPKKTAAKAAPAKAPEEAGAPKKAPAKKTAKPAAPPAAAKPARAPGAKKGPAKKAPEPQKAAEPPKAEEKKAAAPAVPPRHRPPRPAATGARRKTKRERRLEKKQARMDRREKLEQTLEEARAKASEGEAVFLREGITVKELADKLNVKVKDIIAKLMMRGVMATINQTLDADVAIEVSSMFGYSAEIISFEDELVLTQETPSDAEKEPRAPVVTVMGHVDHGKSTLLEAIHNINITGKEFGGITQHIGAYRVSHKDRGYVFLDTPGHEAFTLMRARGAKVTDVVILVVAADDGVMPQTVEAINHCKAAEVPMIVAINKMDKPDANPDRVKQELSQHGVLTEDWGGDVVCVPISAKTGKGMDDLLDLVALVADMLDLQAVTEQLCQATVLESRLDKSRGPVATVLVQEGTLKVGDFFLCGSTYGRVRGLFDDKGERLEKAGPSTPVEILGFSEVPAVGAVFQGMDDEAKARQVSAFRKEKEQRAQRAQKLTLDNVFGAIQEGEIQELPLIIKADVHGSLEAIVKQLEDLSTDEVKVNIVHKGVGAVSESDVLLATASHALIFAFNVRPDRKAAELAKAEEVELHLFTVIYDLVDRLKQALSGMLKPIEKEVVLGHAEVKEIFRISGVGTIAGCMVENGKIVREARIRVLRDNVVVHQGAMASLKRFKDDASEVKEGLECGIGVENFNDLKPGDVLEAYEIQMETRTL